LAPSHCPTMPPIDNPHQFICRCPMHRSLRARRGRAAPSDRVPSARSIGRNHAGRNAPARNGGSRPAPGVQIGVRGPHVPEKSTTCVGFASQKTGLGSTWEAAQRDGEAAELLLRSRAPERGNLDRHGAPDMLGLIGRQCLEAGAEPAPVHQGLGLESISLSGAPSGTRDCRHALTLLKG